MNYNNFKVQSKRIFTIGGNEYSAASHIIWLTLSLNYKRDKNYSLSPT
jgi:hypothetical protein